MRVLLIGNENCASSSYLVCVCSGFVMNVTYCQTCLATIIWILKILDAYFYTAPLDNY